MSELENAVVIAHPFLAPVQQNDIVDALAPATWTATTRSFRFGPARDGLGDLADADWQQLLEDLARDEFELQRILSSATGPVIYFGMAPIPITLELGRRIGPTRRIVAYQQRHDSKSLAWPTVEQTVTAALLGIPDRLSPARGDVIVQVGCSHPVRLEDVRRVVPYPIAELSIDVEAPHEDVLRSEADVSAVAALFGDALDGITRWYPNCETIHLFAAVPPALALRMGAEINPTIHAKPIQTYQYASGRSPRYVGALVLGHRARPPLTNEQRRIAAATRNSLQRSLDDVRALTTLAIEPGTWLADVLGPAAAGLSPALHRLGPLGRNLAIADAEIAAHGEADGEFAWHAEDRLWIFDDRLLAALGGVLEGADLAIAGRLFLLHEAIHVAKQNLTSATADGMGRLPRVLEEIDYLADVWALVNEYARAVHAGEVEAASAPKFFRERVRVMTATFWAFDAANLPLAVIPIRRLNRYLIWYWIRIALERVDALDGVLRLLGTKPILELSGPRIRVVDNRVVFDLDPACFGDVELGLLQEGYRIVRVGTRAGAQVRALLEAVQAGQEARFLDALRGVFDGVVRDDVAND